MDIVEWLREKAKGFFKPTSTRLKEAADEIERLREALQLIALGDELGITKQGFANSIAKNALQQKESE